MGGKAYLLKLQSQRRAGEDLLIKELPAKKMGSSGWTSTNILEGPLVRRIGVVVNTAVAVDSTRGPGIVIVECSLKTVDIYLYSSNSNLNTLLASLHKICKVENQQ